MNAEEDHHRLANSIKWRLRMKSENSKSAQITILLDSREVSILSVMANKLQLLCPVFTSRYSKEFNCFSVSVLSDSARGGGETPLVYSRIFPDILEME